MCSSVEPMDLVLKKYALHSEAVNIMNDSSFNGFVDLIISRGQSR